MVGGSQNESGRNRGSTHHALPWHALAPVALGAVAVPIILSGDLRGAGAADQLHYHGPTIEAFAEQLPRPDLSDYASATTPGYHLLLAMVVRLGLASTQPEQVTLRFISLLFSLALVAVLAWAVSRRTDSITALCLSLPLCVSHYVITSAAWLVPDNLGWLGVLVVLLMALRDRHTWRSCAVAGVVLLLLVLVRQIHVWAAAALWVSASGRRFLATIPMLVATVPAFLTLALFYQLWNGHLTPPTEAALDLRGVNPVAPAFLLALVGFAGVFYLPMLWRVRRDLWKRCPLRLVAAATVGAIIAALPETSFSREAGRWTGLWTIVATIPAPLERSPIIIALAGAGAVTTALWAAALPPRRRWVYLAALVSFPVAAAGYFQAFQRYFEPFVLILTALVTAEVVGKSERRPRHTLLGPVALALLLAVITGYKLATAEPVVDRSRRESPPQTHQMWRPGSQASRPNSVFTS